MRRLTIWVILALVVASLLVLWGWGAGWIGPNGRSGSTTPTGRPSFQFEDTTGRLGATFVHGAPQAFGYNGSSALVTGVVGDPGNVTVPYPLLGAYGGTVADPEPQNLSAQVAELFHGGDTLGIGWNGTTWLITGEAAWGTTSTGAAAALTNGHWTNLTPLLTAYFGGRGGIWFDAWNGTAWLLGGASDSGAALVSLEGSTVRDLTGLIPNNAPNCWIQFIAWNGTTWLVGGHGVFGTLVAGHYNDFLPDSTFRQGGVFAGDWNGSAWLVGGGTPASIEYLSGSRLVEARPLSGSFSWWVNAIVWDGEGWYVGGAGSSLEHPFDAVLEYLDSAKGTLSDLTSDLPSSFVGGQVEFGARAPGGGLGSALLIGQGGLASSGALGGPSTGAGVLVTRVG